MRVTNCTTVSFVLAQMALLASILLVDLTSSAESTDISSESEASMAQLSSRQKRAPGWGKRGGLVEELDEESDSARELMDRVATLKRAPGWGKRFDSTGLRNDEIDLLDGALEQEKRAPGWGKRAPGWGKRAPGWGKRAPGWGKRAPGWGKRAPGWGKRAPGWGKRSDDEYCEMLDKMVDAYVAKAVQVDSRRIAECGSGEEANEPSRK